MQIRWRAYRECYVVDYTVRGRRKMLKLSKYKELAFALYRKFKVKFIEMQIKELQGELEFVKTDTSGFEELCERELVDNNQGRKL